MPRKLTRSEQATWLFSWLTTSFSFFSTLQAIFETNVPAAVVVMKPASVNLPEMAPGNLFYGALYCF
jgi:hypothetical protein